MNPLLTAEHCTLYHLDSTFIAKARFNQPTSGSITLIFSEKPDFRLPDKFYLMPEGSEQDFISYLCTRLGSFSKYYVETTDRTYYTVEVVTKDTPKLREELRVNVSMDAEADFEGILETKSITIKDVSAGGMMFISTEKLEKGTMFSSEFTTAKGPIPVSARIVSVRPTHLPGTFAYSCQFTGLLAREETAIRNFVFTEDLIQKRRAEES